MEEEKAVADGLEVESEEARAERLEREERERAEATERARLVSEANCARVAFRQAVVKDIIHPHSSSILAKEGTVAALSAKLEAAARTAFAEVATPRPSAASLEEGADAPPQVLEIPATVSVVSKLLVQIEATPLAVGGAGGGGEGGAGEGAGAFSDLLGASVAKLLPACDADASPTFTEEEWLSFVAKWQNPPFYYGERARKLVGRGCLADCLDIFTRGCSVNTADGEGTTSLHYCAEFNRVDIVRALADAFQGGLMLNPKDKAGWTPLHNAVHLGNLECVQELLARGASANSANSVGKTPLHSAAAQGRADIARLLLDNGADQTAGDSTGMTALHEAAYKAQRGVYDLLLQAEGAGAAAAATDKLGNRAEDYLGDYRADAGGAGGAGGVAGVDQVEGLPVPPAASTASVRGSGSGSRASSRK